MVSFPNLHFIFVGVLLIIFEESVFNLIPMNTIIIRPKSKEEEDLLTRLLTKMDIDIQLLEGPMPNLETRKAMDDVRQRKGTRVKDSTELFSRLGI